LALNTVYSHPFLSQVCHQPNAAIEGTETDEIQDVVFAMLRHEVADAFVVLEFS
jgi:hypothetical protein